MINLSKSLNFLPFVKTLFSNSFARIFERIDLETVMFSIEKTKNVLSENKDFVNDVRWRESVSF